MRTFHCPHPSRASGLTLIEVVVVLMILVLIATTAITATEHVVDDARATSNETTLRSIEQALLGRYDAQAPHETNTLAGFVADIGRLPQVVGTEPETMLSELWLPGSLPPFAITHPPGDPEVRIAAGWRGPYLKLPLGQARLLDGYGNPFHFYKADGTDPAIGDPIERIVSRGANNALAGDGVYDADIELTLHRTEPPITVAPRHLASIAVRVTLAVPLAEDESLYVRVYGAQNGAPITVLQTVLPRLETQLEYTYPIIAQTAAPLVIGGRALRVYVVRKGEEPVTENHPIDDTPRSRVIPLQLLQGGPDEIVVTIP